MVDSDRKDSHTQSQGGGDHHAHAHSEHGDNHHDHNDHHRMMIKDFKKRFWVSSALTVPILVLSPMIQSFLGYSLVFDGIMWVLFALSSAVFLYGGWPFLKGLLDELKMGAPGMMTLIAVAITTAYAYSSAVVFGLDGKLFFWELATLVDIMLIGHWIEMKSVLGASKAMELLTKMMPSKAHKVEEDAIKEVKLSELEPGDVVLVKPGERVPADGEIVEGESSLNESMLTGESKPISKGKGEEVIGGSVNGSGSLRVQVDQSGDGSYLSQVIRMVKESQQTKSKTQNLANRAAKWLAFISLGVGGATFAIWLILGYELVFALERMVTVMVISCPHALGLAIPLVVAISTSHSARNGLLIRNRTAFENARKITTMVFDKTGTLTEGNFGVQRFISLSDKHEHLDILRLASSLEQESEHPIAEGIVKKAQEEGLHIPQASNFNAITGKGVQAEIDGKMTMVVGPNYLREQGIDIPDESGGSNAETVVFLLVDGKLLGFIALADKIRPESHGAVRQFQDMGIKVIMATGDNKKVAKAVAEELGLDDFFAEQLPDGKVEIIERLSSKGEFIAMTGDGVNDAPALAKADIGIAVGSGTDVAAETADIILAKSNPQDILNLIRFGKSTYRKMIQNIGWATGYNAFSIPLAAGVLYPIGFILNPAVGAVLMSLSTVIVAINAQLLKRSLRKKEA